MMLGATAPASSFAQDVVGPEAPIAEPGMNIQGGGGYLSLPRASIVARVDDEVILLEEIIGPVAPKLKQARAQLPPAEYRKIEERLLQQMTDAKIDRLVVLKELKTKLPKPEAIKVAQKAARKEYENYLQKLTREFGLKTADEVKKRLTEEGSNLKDLERDFVDNLIAQQYISQLVRTQVKDATRDELMRYYREHTDAFRTEPGVIWRQIEVKFNGNPAEAETKIRALYEKLQGGEDFAVIAKKSSEGPTAFQGGAWTLTSKGSYADNVVDEALFQTPVGDVSGILRGESSFHIVKVEQRSDGSPQPFEDVQEDIKRRLKMKAFGVLRDEKIAELRTKHHVETVFENPNIAQTASKDKGPQR